MTRATTPARSYKLPPAGYGFTTAATSARNAPNVGLERLDDLVGDGSDHE